MKHTYTVEESDKADHESGLELIRVLRLKKQRHNGLYGLTHGNKTPCGVFRTVRGLCMSHAELHAEDTTKALKALYDHITDPRNRAACSSGILISLQLIEDTQEAITKATA